MTDDRRGGPPDTGHDTASSLIDAAQKAAGDQDFAEAERLLRRAAAIQEATLGGEHPDLAITLNNLAYVCERTGNLDEAERGYRRAHKIAVASLSPGHPFIKTSLSNLMEFCEAHGIPIWTRPETPVEDEPLPDEVAAPATDIPSATGAADIPPAIEAPGDPAPTDIPPAIVQPSVAAAGRLPFRMMAVAALAVIVIVVIGFALPEREATGETRPAASAGSTTEPSAPAEPPTASPASDVTVPDPVPATAPPPASAPEPEPPRSPEPPPAPPPPAPTAPRSARAGTDVPVTVLNAQLCTTLERRGSRDWQCTPPGSDARPGRYTFYTRLLATAETTVEHRWYLNGRVHQTMRLRVSPNPAAGYRTFSTTTVSPERTGEWKVELRAADGSVVAEESFLVR